MSASLVGSEMCIRDRPPPSPPPIMRKHSSLRQFVLRAHGREQCLAARRHDGKDETEAHKLQQCTRISHMFMCAGTPELAVTNELT
eukprot:7673822-Alexandrium_andersonii.AAC.1